MSLIKKQSMTDKNLAAHQSNGRRSRGAATAEGKERSRAASLRHGFYSQGREEALRALGEDPAELDALIEATHEEWRPPNAFRGRLGERLARLLWRMERAERIQESLAARLMQQHEQRRQEVARQVLRAGNARLDALALLEENVADPRFYTPRTCFREFCEAFGKKVHGAEEEILLLMHRLRKPEDRAGKPRNVAPNPASQVPSPDAEGEGIPQAPRHDPSPVSRIPNPAPEDKALPPVTPLDPNPESRVPNPDPVGAEAPDEDTYLMELEQLDADDFPVPWPKIAVTQGAERNELREELWRLVREHQKIVQTALDSERQEHEAPLSRLEQDELQAAPHRHAELMRREEESCFRQFMRLGNFLMKFQDHAVKHAENEGPSGYVDENPGGEQTGRTTNSPEPLAAGTGDVILTGRNVESKVAGTESEVRSPGSEVGIAESEVRNASSEVAGAGSGVEGGRPSEIGAAVIHGRMPDSRYRINPGPSLEAVDRIRKSRTTHRQSQITYRKSPISIGQMTR